MQRKSKNTLKLHFCISTKSVKYFKTVKKTISVFSVGLIYRIKPPNILITLSFNISPVKH